ncbi:unnamed protein product [Lupinus luteus]|uniref:Uncharacterized protein n=1 Tax=Lupinus luteus TaxID=3873 RepID=A0AAV1Y2U2_LUPLU
MECGERVQCLKSGAISNGVEVANGNASAEETPHLKREAFNNGVAFSDGNGVIVAVSGGNDVTEEALFLESEAINNGVAIENGNALCLKSEIIRNVVAIANEFDSADGDSGGLECLRTYKRCKHRKSSSESKIQEDKMFSNEILKTDKDGQECSSQLERLSHRAHSEANGHFSSLRKALLENFQGVKPESILDFNTMTSWRRKKAYEQSPALFLSDMQQFWKKLQNAGNEIVALAKSLSNMSRTSYCELVGLSAQSTFDDEAQLVR